MNFAFNCELRRYNEVQNPEKMRSEYGKMIYLLQDSQMGAVQELLEFKVGQRRLTPG
jgi:hypothetical protein